MNLLKKYFTLFFPLSLAFALGSCSSSPYAALNKAGIAADKEMDKIGRDLAHRHDVHFLLSGFNPTRGMRWGVRFISDKELTINEAEILAAELIDDLMKTVSHNKTITSYVTLQAKDSEEYRLEHNKPPLAPEQVYNYDYPFLPCKFHMRLAFWDKDVNRPLAPYIAHIELVKGKVGFFYADPQTQALTQPVVITLDDLLAERISPTSGEGIH